MEQNLQSGGNSLGSKQKAEEKTQTHAGYNLSYLLPTTQVHLAIQIFLLSSWFLIEILGHWIQSHLLYILYPLTNSTMMVAG